MATLFKVGDEVEVVGGEYVYTTPGSRGIIIGITEHSVFIKWSLIKNIKNHSSSLIQRAEFWDIDPEYLELVDNVTTGPYRHVIRKIKSMEQKRKERGYVF